MKTSKQYTSLNNQQLVVISLLLQQQVGGADDGYLFPIENSND